MINGLSRVLLRLLSLPTQIRRMISEEFARRRCERLVVQSNSIVPIFLDEARDASVGLAGKNEIMRGNCDCAIEFSRLILIGLAVADRS